MRQGDNRGQATSLARFSGLRVGRLAGMIAACNGQNGSSDSARHLGDEKSSLSPFVPYYL
ncbi:hypothetical protein LCGC14_2480850, partial [marine sediment metagenome]